MKKVKLRLLCMLFALSFMFLIMSGMALNVSHTENSAQILDHLDFEPLERGTQNGLIQCFDVSSSGLIALGFGSGETGYVCVYDRTEFVYGYQFNVYGTYKIRWNGDNIEIGFVRGNYSVELTPEGDVVDLCYFKDANPDSLSWINLPDSNSKTVGVFTYQLRNQMGIFNLFQPYHSQLVQIDSQGNETVLYDVGFSQLLGILIILLCVVFAVSAVVVFGVYKCLKRIGTRSVRYEDEGGTV